MATLPPHLPAPLLARRAVGGDTGDVGRGGKTVVVNAWASWCGPCREETPMLVRYQEKTKDRGVVVLGLNEDHSASEARAFARDFHMSYPSVLDPDGKRFRALAKGLMSAQGLPVTFVVDTHGRFAATAAGALTENRLASLVGAARAKETATEH
ncbi:TlpA disulfide reductase family protein [Streptomyces sp. NPDC046805]|uniref:TlpA family protein disulfide reductase n=1 Tax=Streptomyces sp. NPDC046805 TaxID=3155134 RepID=UPI0033FCA7D2